jgi:hypothetical protein
LAKGETINGYRVPAGRFARNGDPIRIAAKRGDVVFDPLQRGDLVPKGLVPGGVVGCLRGKLGMGEEAEHAETVIYRDEDHAVLHDALAAFLPPGAARAADKPAAVNIKQDGIGLACFVDGRPNIERQAVLALLLPIGGLAADRSEFRRLACALPGFHRLWCPPAQVACGRGSIGNPQKRHHAVLFISRELSAVDRDSRCAGCAGALG